MSISLGILEKRVKEKLRQELPALKHLKKARISTGERKRIAEIIKLGKVGLEELLRRRNDDSQADTIEFFEEFLVLGANAILNTGAQRGGDFLNNQLQGRWAEHVVQSMNIDRLVLMPFGPSGAAMPGEEDFRKVVTNFKHIGLVEGKRPDKIAYRRDVWNSFSKLEKKRIKSWPGRVLDKDDDELVRRAVCGIEVKNSAFHYETRRKYGGGPLSVPVKKEEIHHFTNWSSRTKIPIIFFLLTFDEIYAMSFDRMMEAKKRGHLYENGDYLLDEQTGARGPNESNKKIYHRFLLYDFRHLCGKVRYPSDSHAVIQILKDGHVVPYIRYNPSSATKTESKVVWKEVEYGLSAAKKKLISLRRRR